MRGLLGLVVVVVVVAGCLSPGSTPYTPVDVTAPKIDRITPAMGGDAGTPEVPGDQIFEIVFSEGMDPGSLRPGIVVRNARREEQVLELHAVDAGRPSLRDSDSSYVVRINSRGTSFAPGAYQLILRTLLIDQQGNALENEFLGGFRVRQ